MTTEPEIRDPAALLAEIRDQEESTRRALHIDPAPMFLGYGAALMIGYLAMYAAAVELIPGAPPWWGGPVMVLALVAATLDGLRRVHRATAGVAGPSNLQGLMWGLSWPLAFFGMWLIGSALISRGLPESLVPYYFTGASGLVIAILYLGGGVALMQWSMYTLGVWIALVFTAGLLVGLPLGYLVIAAGCAIGFLAAALAGHFLGRRR